MPRKTLVILTRAISVREQLSKGQQIKQVLRKQEVMRSETLMVELA